MRVQWNWFGVAEEIGRWSDVWTNKIA